MAMRGRELSARRISGDEVAAAAADVSDAEISGLVWSIIIQSRYDRLTVMDNSKAGLTRRKTARRRETFTMGPHARMLHDESKQFRLADGGPTIQTVLRDDMASDP